MRPSTYVYPFRHLNYFFWDFYGLYYCSILELLYPRKDNQNMKIFAVTRAIASASASIAIGAIPALAGVPESETIPKGKWQRVNSSWTIDTEDLEIKGDQIRFWVKRNATGNEEMSTQSRTSYTGKLRIRCSDFHTRIEAQVIDIYTYYSKGPWERITPSLFAYTLASNFCYLTNTPGFTPEPIVHVWQEKITAEIKKQITPGAI
ncbi:hypothetical protein N8696_00805, partial [bacterium]|nr:hypothetical protein [bacterium]MDA7633959.1 hypothetical protein [bacterium]